MIPFGTNNNIGKSYCLPTLIGWIAWPIYLVRNVKATEKSDLYDMCCLNLILSWDFV